MPARPMGKGGPDWNFSQKEAVEDDPGAAAVILLPVTEQGLSQDAAANRRGVVANVAEGPGVTVITVVNLAREADGKAKGVEIAVSGLRPARDVRTATKQAARVEAGRPVVRLEELDDAEVIVVRH
jgi:hypothetical protein